VLPDVVMKSHTQTLLLVVVLVGLIGGVTFVRNWISSKATTVGPTPDPGKEIWIKFPSTVAGGSREFEAQLPGHHDFEFENDNPETVELGLDSKNCRCSEVEALILSAEEQKKIEREKALAEVAGVLEAPACPLQVLGHLAGMNDVERRFLERADHWQSLLGKEESKAAAVETVASVPAQAHGYVRLTWRGKKPGFQKLIATVWTQRPGDPKTRGGRVELTVPVHSLAPIRVHPETVQVPDLKPNQTFKFDCYCFSSTRSEFKLLEAKEETDNPCFQCTVTHLNGPEFDKAVSTLREVPALNSGAPVLVLCAYRISVTVHERLPNNGPQLELGPFARKLLLATDQEEYQYLPVAVNGVVRGEVTVGTDESRDKIVLKTFDSARGASATVPVETTIPGLKLAIQSWEPDYLVVSLDQRVGQGPEGGARWDLKVTVPRSRAVGPMPENSAVILKTGSEPPRMIRVPIKGRATVSLDGR
jgi:hypothetical protein